MFRPISIYLLIILLVSDKGGIDSNIPEYLWLVLLLFFVPCGAVVSAIYAKKTRGTQLYATYAILLSWGSSVLFFPLEATVNSIVGYKVIVGDAIVLFPAIFWLFSLWLVTAPSKNRFSIATYRLRLDFLLLFIPVFLFFGLRHVATSVVNIPIEYAEMMEVAAFLFLLACAPWLITMILPAKQMKNFELRTLIVEGAMRAGIRNANVLVWNTHQRIMNALAMGILFQPKSIILTDKLISHLNQKELLAVTSHEFGHHKYWHIPFLIITLVCTLVWSTKVLVLLGFDVSSGYEYVLQLMLVVGAIVGVSRQFEEQADAYSITNLSLSQGSEVITQDAANAMTNALETIAQTHSINADTNDPLHGSIQSRKSKLQSLVGCHLLEIPINKKVKKIKIALLIIMFVGFVV